MPDNLPLYSQMDLTNAVLPDPSRFPHNASNTKVRKSVFADLLASTDPLIVTGYASLGMLLTFFTRSQEQQNPLLKIRVLLGHEPTETLRQDFSNHRVSFSRTFYDYWLHRGISLYQSAEVLLALDLVERGVIQVRIASDTHPLHAKMYKGDNAVTLGSSNFSFMGLEQQIEANARFERTDPSSSYRQSGMQQAEQKRFEEASQFAEHLWDEGSEYTQPFLALLMRLLRSVTWQEALARACAEILEGSWAQHYVQEIMIREGPPLWPSQQQGLVQAMWIIEQVGSVLIADATGSGKTQMGAYLIRAVMNRIWSRGHRRRHDLPIMVSPASVVAEWERTSNDCGQPLRVYSDGAISSKHAAQHEEIEAALRRAQVLGADEAHRYHNRRSARTQLLYRTLADHMLLFTATPVNRGASDLLALIDLLGADNFEDDVVAIFERFRYASRKNPNDLSLEERRRLQQAIQQFTVRRTKTTLNAMIAKEPERYRDRNGKQCRYPDVKACKYTHTESAHDLFLIQEISDAAARLRGLLWLNAPFVLSELLLRKGVTEEEYVELRLKAAQNLAIYCVMASLRSSRIALLEHLCGTEEACSYYGLPFTSLDKKKGSGNILAKLDTFQNKLPVSSLSFPLPLWLSSPDEFNAALIAEKNIYRSIVDLIKRLSDGREQRKANLLVELQKKHRKVIAFDETVISLIDLQHRLQAMALQAHIVLATGSEKAGRRQVVELTSLDSVEADLIALCSDAMSEGLNMQGASVVVHLTNPTVIRIAEQRVGRIERMNSPFAVVESYWPDEKSVLRLRADARFQSRYQFVADYLGSNLTLPDIEHINVDVLVEEQKQDGTSSDLNTSIKDAFEPVRALISGPTSLVSDATLYEHIRSATAHVLSAVSIVTASAPWAFFAVSGTEWGAPRWVYLASPHAIPLTDLEQISIVLRQHLEQDDTHKVALNKTSTAVLATFLDRLHTIERSLLPRKKQKALLQMSEVLTAYQKQAHAQWDKDRLEIVTALRDLVDNTHRESTVDWSSLAEEWLDLIHPTWYEYQKYRSRKTVLLLKELTPVLIEKPLSTSSLDVLLRQRTWTSPVDERIVAAIVGIPSAESEGNML